MEQPRAKKLVMTLAETVQRHSPPSPSSSNCTNIDGRLWRNLPQPLLDRILTFLPPPAFFRARCVCRRWYAFLYSNAFLELHRRLAPRHDWLIFFDNHSPKNNNVYSTAAITHSHRPPPLGLLLDTVNDVWYRIPFEDVMPPGFSPEASNGGLLCWVSDEAGPKSVILCNPLSKSISQLPAVTKPRLFPSVGLTVRNNTFSIVIAGDDLISQFAVKNLTTEGFLADGTTGFYSPWTTISKLPRLCNMESGRMIFKDGTFYSMSHTPFSVLAYDTVATEWSKIQAPMRRFLRSPSIVGCDEKVLLVAMVEKSKLNVPRSVRVWELQYCRTTWVEVERMPQETYNEFAQVEKGRGFECFGQGDTMGITVHGSDLVLLHDLPSKAWRWAPPCPFLHGRTTCGLRGFGFEPRLCTPAIELLHSSSLFFQAFPTQ